MVGGVWILYHHQNKCVVEYSTTVGIWAIIGCGVSLDTGSLRDCVAEVIRLFVCALYGSVYVGVCYRLRLILLVDTGNPI